MKAWTIKRLAQLTLIASTMFLAACGVLTPYQAELKEGNAVLPAQLEQLEVGQNKEQVRFILGTPMLSPERLENRWIYPIYDDDNGYRHLIVDFNEQERVSLITLPVIKAEPKSLLPLF